MDKMNMALYGLIAIAIFSMIWGMRIYLQSWQLHWRTKRFNKNESGKETESVTSECQDENPDGAA
jgi:hypothetical protein